MVEYMPLHKSGDAHALLLDGDHHGAPDGGDAKGGAQGFDMKQQQQQANPAAAAAQRAVAAAVRSTLGSGSSRGNLLAGAPADSLEDQGSYVPATIVPHTAS